jgi:hypothetical protein
MLLTVITSLQTAQESKQHAEGYAREAAMGIKPADRRERAAATILAVHCENIRARSVWPSSSLPAAVYLIFHPVRGL